MSRHSAKHFLAFLRTPELRLPVYRISRACYTSHVKCERCGTFLVVDKGAYVCPNCGLVYPDAVFDENPQKCLAADTWGYGSFVYRPSMLKTMQIRLSHTALFVAMSRAKRLAKELQEAMGLGSAECDAILADFHRLIRRIPGRRAPVNRPALLTALAYLRLKERGRRINLRSVVAQLRASGVRISVGDVLRALVYLRDCGWRHERAWADLLKHYAALASRTMSLDNEKLLLQALCILERTRKNVTGRNRDNVAAAIIYVCSEQMGQTIPLYKFARLTRVPVTSLRNNVMLIRSLLLEESFEEHTCDFLKDCSTRDEAEEALPITVGDPSSTRREDDRRDGKKVLFPVYNHSGT